MIPWLRSGLLSVALVMLGAPNSMAQLAVTETLRIGGPDEGPYLFSDIRGLAPGLDGSIFVLEYRTQEIRLFDGAGRFVKQVARRGSGPGEIADANGLLTAPNGEVWVNEARSKTGGGTAQIPFLPSPVSAWDRRGFVWCSSRDRYDVLQIRVERGDTVRRVTLDAAPFPVPKAERDSAVDGVRTFFTKMGAPEPDYSRIPSVKPPIESIDVDDRGRLWVRRPTADSRRTSFDLWDERATRPVTITAPWRLSPYFHPVFRGDTLLTWTRDEDDVPFVVRGVVRR